MKKWMEFISYFFCILFTLNAETNTYRYTGKYLETSKWECMQYHELQSLDRLAAKELEKLKLGNLLRHAECTGF